MRKDYILTREEKLLKQQRLEENRRIRSEQVNKQVNEMEVQRNVEPTTIPTECEPVDQRETKSFRSSTVLAALL